MRIIMISSCAFANKSRRAYLASGGRGRIPRVFDLAGTPATARPSAYQFSQLEQLLNLTGRFTAQQRLAEVRGAV